jgi:hydroxymethylpyrimidine pyrophosphatase-like HAD family hydrolase
MHISVIATDFDGTISQGDQLAPEVIHVLHRWRERGQFTVLASGRPFEFLHALQQREPVFDLIVAENGAVLYNPRNDEMSLPFGEVPGDLIDMLVKLGVPLWRGVAIAGTTMPYDDAIWVASRELGLAVHVETNRNEVMLLPPGASKGAGLSNVLKGEGLSARNVLAFGDAENDHSLFEAVEVRVAVANASDSLKAMADHVTPEAGPLGVASFVERYLLDGRAFDFPIHSAHHFALGATQEIKLNSHELVDRSILIAGGSGYGKSWLASQLATGLIDGGYQLLGLDPVGDLHMLKRHATCLCLGSEGVPPISLVIQLLAETDLSMVLSLSHMPTQEEQILYTTGLLRHVLEVRQRYGKPHWLLIDEAQDLVGGPDNPVQSFLLGAPAVPGICLVTWRPSLLSRATLNRMDGFLLTRHSLSREIDWLSQLLADRGLDAIGLADQLGNLGEGQTVMWGVDPSSGDELMPLRFNVGPRTFPGMHRLHRYLEERVPPSRRFYFDDATGRSAPVGNLSELIDRMRLLDLSVIEFHFHRGDFAKWIRGVLHDQTLARWLDRLQTTDLRGEPLRLALLEAFEQRHRVLERLL